MLGALIGAGASIASSLLGKKSADKANEAAERQNAQNIALQKEFAQSGIQWKVQDAEKAGVHPLFALGANTTSFQPQSIGSSLPDWSGIAEAGQNVGRAIDATRSTPASAMALALGKIQLEGAQLDNEFKKVQLASALRTNAIGSHPGLPGPFTRSAIDGQASSGQTDDTLIPLMHAAREPQFTPNIRGWGSDIAPNPNWSDAQTWEDRYGETISDWIVGPSIAFSDWRHNTRSRDPNHYEKVRRGMSHQNPRRKY